MALTESHQNGMPVWVDVMVSTTEQREQLMSFYSSIFAWTWRVEGPEMGYYSMALHDASPVMGLGEGPGGAGQMVTYFRTSDIEATAKRVSELGGSVFVGPMKVADVGSMALALDPVGAVHGLWQPDSFQGFAALYETGTPGWFDHASGDPGRASDYYRDLTGHEVIEPEPSMRVLRAGEQWFASVSNNPLVERPSQWNAIYIVDSLEETRQKVRVLGGSILLEEMPVPGSALTVFSEPVMNTVVTVMRGGHGEG